MDYRRIAEGAGPRIGVTQEWVYKVLHYGIVSGEIPGGTQLKQDEISHALNVSHIPVREAMRRLESLRLVHIQPNRGATVTQLDRGTILDMMEVRASLSSMLLLKSAPLLTDQDYAEMEEILSREATDIGIKESEELNYRFHGLLFSHSNNPVAILFMDLIHVNIDRYLRHNFYAPQEMRERTTREHREIMETCRKGDYQKAAQLMSDHILNAKDMIPEDL